VIERISRMGSPYRDKSPAPKYTDAYDLLVARNAAKKADQEKSDAAYISALWKVRDAMCKYVYLGLHPDRWDIRHDALGVMTKTVRLHPGIHVEAADLINEQNIFPGCVVRLRPGDGTPYLDLPDNPYSGDLCTAADCLPKPELVGCNE
jgi:hypothetical protein